MEPRNDSPNYSYFTTTFKKFERFRENVLSIDDFIRNDDILCIKVKSETKDLFAETANLIFDIKTTFITLADKVRAMEMNVLDSKFSTMSGYLCRADLYEPTARNAINNFINSKDISHLNILESELRCMNERLLLIKKSKLLIEISKIKTSTFIIRDFDDSSLSDDSVEQSNTADENDDSTKQSNMEILFEDEGLVDYIELSKYFDLNSRDFKNILKYIMNPVEDVFRRTRYKKPTSAKHYSAIIGPSFMGKTQFSFILAIVHPVFYFNFSTNNDNIEAQQNVYKNFDSYATELKKALNRDGKTILKSWKSADFKKKKRRSVFESNYLFKNNHLKLFTIGFIWGLIKHSLEFDYSNTDEHWYRHYLKSRSMTYAALSLSEFHRKMKTLFANETRFKVPIVFIDELNSENANIIKLLRNIVRCLVLPCVLSSTNTNVINMLNLKSTSSTASTFNWVNCICRLLKTNIIGIMNRIKIGTKKLIEYLNEDHSLKLDDESYICLLLDLEITTDVENQQKLMKIWKFILSQSQTCLQGASYFCFNLLIRRLMTFSGKSLDSLAIWENICTNIGIFFRCRKNEAFQNDGLFFGLRMFSTKLKFDKNQVQSDETFVRKSIDNHFYYFGDVNGPYVLSFSHDSTGIVNVAKKSQSFLGMYISSKLPEKREPWT